MEDCHKSVGVILRKEAGMTVYNLLAIIALGVVVYLIYIIVKARGE
jgi:hypothetical protein